MRTLLLISILITSSLRLIGQNNESLTPDVPSGLSSQLIEKGGKTYIKLSWSPKVKSDTLTYGYLVYNNFPPGKDLYLNTRINLTRNNSIEYEVKRSEASEYLFAVTARSSFPDNVESAKSEIQKIQTTSRVLPLVKIKNHSNRNNKSTISWDYPEILDLGGFNIYLNGNQIEKEIDEKARKVTISLPESKKKPYIQIIAFSKSGVKSDISPNYFLMN